MAQPWSTSCDEHISSGLPPQGRRPGLLVRVVEASPRGLALVVVLSRRTASETLIRITSAMNYDKTEIPTTYDKARALAPETIRLWQHLLSVHVDRAEMSLVIDLGCGTGRFSELLAAHFGVQVIGIDPSLKMLDQARRKLTSDNVVYCQGLAEALPF